MLPFFVYGTLRPGEHNYARLLAGRTSAEAPAALAGAALFTEGPYPFLVTAPDLAGPGDLVRGDLVALPPALYGPVLAQLDALEGYVAGSAANLYERVVIEVAAADGPRRAWVYVAGAAALARIRSGAMRRIPGGAWPGPADQT
ncbi:MAG TPA: gamma-glutamylcyclotransferase [Chloroflexaceae bacterium]|nr:gamma-glutamylcyclotransferase [Chloroflexaceae bacterium]